MVAVVVAADTPAGEAAARALAGVGAAVVLVGHDAAALGTLAGSLRDAGGRADLVVGDPADATVAAVLAEMVAELHGPRAAP